MNARSHGLSDALQAFVVQHGVREPEPLARLRAETEKLSEAGWASAPEQTQFLVFLAKLIGARVFLEVGTFTGYTALWMAMELPGDGEVVTLDIVDDFAKIGQPFWREADVEDRIDLRLGDAGDLLDTLLSEKGQGAFDLAYIDANKRDYPDYYEKCLELLRPGGVVVADNMFWNGSVVDPANQEKSTIGIRALAEIAGKDDRVDVSIVPLGDGMLVARKRS